ncbi:RNA 2',3'-cyclic phosphodiesterase [Bacillus sp. OxB-1]|uniref:RNA 2',3'-cyclic phosphodiesterase n=1 Tax=Bacillus sp. (strain OxB-1) TaxID=98228 RepID=UPI000596BC03|nr:RNA 2',3'-cyclic phosphodiesterase [Bacillus sp. OxB-1]
MLQHYFIGIKTPASIVGQVEKYLAKYQLPSQYKVIPHPEDLHITLLFLGDVDSQRLPAIRQQLSDIANNSSAFQLTVDGLSFFGSPKGPRVVYLSVSHPPELDALQQSVNTKITALLGKPLDNRFTPHITIAKKRKEGQPPLSLAKESFDPIPFLVTEFTLFTIHPQNSPKYEAVEVFRVPNAETNVNV